MQNGDNHNGFAIERASVESDSSRFNPEMLTVAREAKRLTQSKLAELIGVSQPVVGKLEAGLTSPAQDHLASLTRELGVHKEFFFISRSNRLASMSDFYHRALAKAKRSDVKAVHARCNIMDIQIDRLLNQGSIPNDILPSIDPVDHGDDVERVASITREAMGVGAGPIQNLVRVIESCGGIVIDSGIDAEGVDALCRWVPGLPKLFYINGGMPADRIRFSLAHELGHTVMHFDSDTDLKTAEIQANIFASAFLMPEKDIRSDLRRSLTVPYLSSMKRKWRVSMQSLIRRARDLGCISENAYTSMCKSFSYKGWRKQEPVSVPGETPCVYADLLNQHIALGYEITDLSNLLFVPESEVAALIDDSRSPNYEGDGIRLRLVR